MAAFSRPVSTARSRYGPSWSTGRPSECSTSQAASSTALVVPWPNETPARSRRAVASSTRLRTLTPFAGTVRATAALLHAEEVCAGQAFDLVERDRLVHLVDRAIHRTELDHLRTDLDDEAPVGGAARGGDPRGH